ncbi:MAG: SDR family NAD(P)-dependent oxidoreductase [Burkholderiaceae bacterium]
MSPLVKLLKLEGRHAVVTGGAMGLGAAVASLLAEQGARVTLLDKAAAMAQQHADSLSERGMAACVADCDVAEQSSVDIAVKQGREQYGRVDILVNCAGIAAPPGMPYTNNTGDDFDRTMAVNVKGMFHTAKACHDDLVASKAGRIVNLSSITGVISAPYMPAYSVSKAAVISLTKVLARDLAPHHVTANAVCPGFIWTPMWDDLAKVMAAAEGSADPAADAASVFEQRVKTHVPMGRAQSALDVAAMVAFLCSDAAANITGQVVGVDGGITI